MCRLLGVRTCAFVCVCVWVNVRAYAFHYFCKKSERKFFKHRRSIYVTHCTVTFLFLFITSTKQFYIYNAVN
jgi:hypothetical protein